MIRRNKKHLNETDLAEILENWSDWGDSDDGIEDETESVDGDIEEGEPAQLQQQIQQDPVILDAGLDLQLLLQNNGKLYFEYVNCK